MRIADSLSRLRELFNPGSLVVAIWVVASLALGRIMGWLTRGLLRRIVRHTSNEWDDQVVLRLGGPLTAAWTIAFGFLGLAIVDLRPGADDTARGLLRGTVVATVFWAFSRLVDVAEHLLATSTWAKRRAASRSFIGLASRIAKVLVVALGILTILSQAGYPVGTLIAGLGIGGLALALGAQKTLENVFAAFSLAADEPFHLGDLVRVDNVLGNIESIGLRSTRIRTQDRTVVVIPNGKLAEMKTESLAARDRLRLSCTLGLVYGTTADQVRRVLHELDGALRAAPKVIPSDVNVVLKGLAPSSLDLDVTAMFATSDWNEFQVIRQGLLLRFLEIVESAGTSLAFPTQTLHVAPPAEARPPAR
jgi:MscS family membrane protein